MELEEGEVPTQNIKTELEKPNISESVTNTNKIVSQQHTEENTVYRNTDKKTEIAGFSNGICCSSFVNNELHDAYSQTLVNSRVFQTNAVEMSFPNLKETISPDPSSNNVLIIPEGNQMFLSMDISTSPFKVPPSRSDASCSDISTNNSAKSAAKESQSSNVSSCFIKSEDLYSMSKIKPNGKLVPNCSDISQFGNGENIMMACENFISQPKVKDELSDVGSPLSTGTQQTGECNQIFENMHHRNNKLTVKDTSQNLKVASLSRRTSPRKRKNETNVCDKELKELCLVPCVVDLGLRVTGHTSLKTLKAYGSEDYATKGSPKSKQISDTQRKTDENIKMLNKGQSHITESQKMPPIKGRQPNASDHYEAVPHSKTRTTRVLQDDQLIYCEDCGREYDGDCPVHGPLVIVEHHAVTTVEYPTLKAVASLPECLSLRPSRNTTGLGIFAASRIKYRSRFGPYHGAVINDSDEAHSEGHLWQIYRDGEASHYLDGSNLEHCNWMRFVNIAPSESEQNVTAFQYRGQIYFKTNRNLTTGQELLIWPWCKSGEVRSAISDQLPEESSTTQTAPQTLLNAIRENIRIRQTPCFVSADKIGKRGKYQRYSIADKKIILDEAQDLGFQVVSRKYGISDSTLYTWKKWAADMDSPTKTFGKYRKTRQGGGPKYSMETEQKIVSWVLKQQDIHLHVSHSSFQTYAKNLIVKECPDYRCSNGWVEKFRRRNRLNPRNTDILSRKMPPDLEQEIKIFRQQLSEIYQRKKFESELIITVDEVQLNFEFLPHETEDGTVAKPAPKITPGRYSRNSTVVLAVTASGTKLPPLVIFRDTRDLNITCPDGWVVKSNQSAWMTEDIMKDWLEDILQPHSKGLPSLLILDSFPAHVTSDVNSLCQSLNCTTAVIPLGCSVKLQPIDASIVKPFKDSLKNSWSACLKVTEEGSPRLTRKEGILKWISTAWDNIPKELIIKSFSLTGDLFYSCQGCPDIQFICKKYVLVHKMQRHGRKLSRDWRKEVDQDFSRNLSAQAMNLSDIEFVEMLGDDLDKVPDSVKRLKVVNPGEKRYQCTECNYSSSFKSDFNRHMRDHAGKIRYKCVLCDSTYASKAGLEVHVRTHTGEKPFHCTECDSQFASKRSLDRHQVDHKGQKQFQCSMCEYQADRKKVLLSHMRTHTGEKPFQCTYCDFRTAHEHSLNLHIRIHTGEKPYECSVCGFRFNARGDLSKHLKIHSNEKPFQCSACPKRFRRKYHLTEHFRVHTGDKPYRCSVCDERFRCSGQLTNHMRLHTGERLQRCTMCEYTCNTITILNKHLRVHTGEKPFQCTFCDYKCSLKNNLNRHIRGHQGLKPYECHFCDYKTGVRASLTRHVQTHTGEKPFPCTLCDFKGSSRKTLNNHLKRHTGEKPFQCSLCSYKCRIKCSLTRHVNISHNEEKRFPCILCGFKCHDKGVLARHLKAHKSEKGLHCTQCNYKTNSKSAFTYHMRNEHPSK